MFRAWQGLKLNFESNTLAVSRESNEVVSVLDQWKVALP